MLPQHTSRAQDQCHLDTPVPADHHRLFMERIRGGEALTLLKRFTLDFHSDPDLEMMTEGRARFLYERGFLPEKARLYGVTEQNIDGYLSDVQRWLTRLVNGEHTIVFNNKVLFTQVFGHHCSVPQALAVWRNGRTIAYSRAWDAIVEGSGPAPRLVAKPLGGGGGGNVYFIRVDSSHAVIETNDPEAPRAVVKRRELPSIFAEQSVPFIINEFVEQGSFTRALYPLTVNTLRALVIRDVDTGEPHIVRAVQRIGTSASYPIDNFSLGGLSAEVDMATGRIGYAVAAEGKYRGQRWEEHPDTGERLVGRVIPHWTRVKETLMRLFGRLPYLRYCGFDLILRDDDVVVLEGNSYSQVRLFQMHEPLLFDARYRRFLEAHGLFATNQR